MGVIGSHGTVSFPKHPPCSTNLLIPTGTGPTHTSSSTCEGDGREKAARRWQQGSDTARRLSKLCIASQLIRRIESPGRSGEHARTWSRSVPTKAGRAPATPAAPPAAAAIAATPHVGRKYLQ